MRVERLSIDAVFSFSQLSTLTLNFSMKHRLLRVNELLKRELSTIITREMNFEGVLVTLNQVDVTP